MDIENWDEVRTAFQVARLGTVSGAADVLGVHHATVIRHIDALEGRLGVKLFQRHARGYSATEAGQDLLQVAQATADQFSQLAGRLHGAGAAMTGELVVTTIGSFSPVLMPVVAKFQAEHPELAVRYISDTRVFRLEYGEAHVAIRAGTKPDDPDNIVQPLYTTRFSLFAHRSYVEKYGKINGPEDFSKHRFVGPPDETARAPFHLWMRDNIPSDCMALRVTEFADISIAVEVGGGVGFMPTWAGELNPDLVPLWESKPEWDVNLWLVTHVDLHRTAKVQAFTTDLKAAAKNWP